jgi:hypothetical protein
MVFLLFVIPSCSDDKEKEEVISLPPPASDGVYGQLENAIKKTLLINEIVESSSKMTLVLSNNSTIELLEKHNVFDLTQTQKPVIEIGAEGTWMVNDKDTRIYEYSSVSYKYDRVICVTYDKQNFTFYLNNGETLVLKRNTTQEIFYFALRSKYNEDVKADIVGTIEGRNITLDLLEKIDSEILVATFKFRGKDLKIGTIEQKTDVTQNDFSTPLIYTLTTETGDKINYTVTFTARLPRIPRVYVETENKIPVSTRQYYINATISIEDPDKVYTDGKSFSAITEIKGRGNSTWGMPKKPYRIKMDKKAPLLGMNSDKSWALMANYSDKTLLRNIAAFEISRIVGLDWTPDCVSVDFYMNGSYQGVYALTEHVKVSKDRADLDLVTPADNSGERLTGDYFLELDFHYDEPYKFKTKKKELPILFKDPEAPTTAQFNYVQDFFNEAENVLYSSNFLDTENGYRKYIDMDSFLKYYLVHELAKNVDGNFRGSCHLALRRNGKIEVPLVWDFDIAFGNANHIVWEQGASSAGPDGWYIKTCSPWFDRFFDDPQFVADLKKRWNELKPQFDLLPLFINSYAERLEAAQKRNFGLRSEGGAGWDIKEVIWPNHVNRMFYSNEVLFLTDFIERRIKWMDENINRL